mmetsp:Transcript_70726/g.167757  ORF Transcript_70726/g.167757 Transcript_70726/m.167757 type:complete len:233 (+) Transcript_70726:756-1454(+)
MVLGPADVPPPAIPSPERILLRVLLLPFRNLIPPLRIHPKRRRSLRPPIHDRLRCPAHPCPPDGERRDPRGGAAPPDIGGWVRCGGVAVREERGQGFSVDGGRVPDVVARVKPVEPQERHRPAVAGGAVLLHRGRAVHWRDAQPLTPLYERVVYLAVLNNERGRRSRLPREVVIHYRRRRREALRRHRRHRPIQRELVGQVEREGLRDRCGGGVVAGDEEGVAELEAGCDRD